MGGSKILLYSNYNILSLNLVEKFLTNFLEVYVVADDYENWLEKSRHLTSNDNFSVKNKSATDDNFDYVLILEPNFIKDAENLYKFALRQSKTRNVKTLLVLNYKNLKDISSEVLPENLSVVFVGDIFGPRMSFGKDSLSRIFLSVVENKRVELSKEEYLYPTYVTDCTEILLKILFSFGYFGEATLMVPKPVTTEGLYYYFAGITKVPGFTYVSYVSPEVIFDGRIEEINVNLKKGLSETLTWFKTRSSPVHLPTVPVISEKVEISRPKTKKFTIKLSRKKYKKVIIASLILLCFIFLPYLFTSASTLNLLVAKFFFEKRRLGLSESFTTISHNISLVNQDLNYSFVQIPLLGTMYRPSANIASVTVKVTNLALTGFGATNAAGKILTGVVSKTDYDLANLSKEVSLSADTLYKDSSFLEADIESSNGLVKQIFQNEVTSEQLSYFKKYLLATKTLSEELPEILGGREEKKYLILFQNNMELRPTGGFMGSFGIFKFKGGNLVEIKVDDVYSADGQLKGHIEPPFPIRAYLGEANWFMRDANWDPDFPTSASRIEWFLDKEINEQVSGVITLDLEAVKQILRVTGPINLPDFDKEITDGNLYETLHSEIEGEFFPGSTKKASLMTALTRKLIVRVGELGEKDFISLSRAVLTSGRERHIQFFLHNQKAQDVLSDLNFDGGVKDPKCTDNCETVYFGLAEANVGVNKANYYLKRAGNFETTLSRGSIANELSVTYDNTENRVAVNKGRYKSFVRILLPLRAQNIRVVASTKNGNKTISDYLEEKVGDRKEVGTLIEVTPGEKLTLTFGWTMSSKLDFSKKGEIGVVWRKQAGTLKDKITAKVVLPVKPKDFFPKGSNSGSLVGESGVYYNTNLASDFIARIGW